MQLPTDWLNDPEQVKLFEARMRAGRLPRRQFLAFMGALGAAAATAACGGTAATPTSAPVATTAPTKAATTAAATTAPTAVPTTAPTKAATGGGAATAPAASPTSGSPTTGGSPAPAAVKLSNWPENLPKPTDLAADQTFRSYVNDEPSSFDYNKDLYATGTTAIWEGLLRFDPDKNLAPGSAASYEVKEGGKVYVFHINPKATWSNGDPVTADDYIWSWTRQLDPATAATYAGFLYDIKGAEAFNTKKGSAKDLGLRAIDKQTLEVTLEGPRGYFPILAAYVAAYPAHRPSVEKLGDKWTDPNAVGGPVVSTGPFVLTKWEHNKSFTIERNEKYATNAKPYLTKITYPIVPRSAGLGPYENNEVDMASFQQIPVGDYPRLQSDPKLKADLIKFSQSGLWYMVPEVDKPPFDDQKVRNAMQHAVDRVQLIKVIQGLGEPAYTLMAPDLPFYIDPAKNPEFKQRVDFNKQTAMDLLKGSKYEGGKGWPPIKMSFRQEGAIPKTAAEYIQRQLKESLNMDVQLEEMEPRSFRDSMYNRKLQLIFIRWYMDYPDPNDFYKLVFYGKTTTGKRQAWVNDKFDTLVNQAASELDPTKRAQLYQDAEKILQEDGVYVPLWYGFAYDLFKPTVGGIPKTSSGIPQPDWNIFIDSHRSLYKKKG